MSEADVREAFRLQTEISARMDAPFTGTLSRLLGQRLDRSTAIGRRVLDWDGAPAHDRDALPLRLAGGLNALARSGQAPGLTAVYPLQATGDEALWAAVEAALREHADFIDPWLDGPPQTNEVGRSAALMAGLLVLADQFGLPFSLYELGASAGLNTVLDRYRFTLGEVKAGEAASPVQLAPEWRGASPPAAPVRIIARRGVDRAPLDVTQASTRERLLAYVWAEQTARRERLEAALVLAAADPAPVDRADAADWLEQVLAIEPQAGVCRVVMHTIAYQYFPPEVQARILAHLDRVGAAATPDAPLAWLAYEATGGGDTRYPELKLVTWPGGNHRVLARGQAHTAWVEWLDNA
jgi:hypothetical protein